MTTDTSSPLTPASLALLAQWHRILDAAKRLDPSVQDEGGMAARLVEVEEQAAAEAESTLHAAMEGTALLQERTAQLQAADAQLVRLREALVEARDSIESWAGYADDYFREKWNLAGDLAAIDAALKEDREVNHDDYARAIQGAPTTRAGGQLLRAQSHHRGDCRSNGIAFAPLLCNCGLAEYIRAIEATDRDELRELEAERTARNPAYPELLRAARERRRAQHGAE